MKDPKRLLSGGATKFESLLLSAGANERPDLELSARMARDLGFTASTGALPAIKAITAGVGKWGVAALTVGAMAVGGNWLIHRSDDAAVEAATPVAANAPPTQRAEPPANVDVSAREMAPAQREERAVPVSELASESSNAVKPGRGRSQAAGSGDQRSLLEEVRLLDEVRAAVHAQKHDQALALLGKYERSYPTGAMKQEATVLKLEALQKNGRSRQASTLGQAFLAEHPESPHAERVKALNAAARVR